MLHFIHISDYGPIDENANDENDQQFTPENMRKAQFRNKNQKVCRKNSI